MASFTSTAVSGKLASDQTDFIWYFDLSNAPSTFWAAVDDAGETIRVLDGATRLPTHVVSINTTDETGWLAFKSDGLSASDNDFTIDTDGSAFSAGADQTFSVTNGGAEAGDTTGWTDETGGISVLTTEEDGPHSGTYWFYSGANAETVSYQDIDVSSLSTEINGGEYAAFIDWWQNGRSGDYGQLYFKFLDSGGSQIGDIKGAGLLYQEPWFRRALFVPIPPNTETVRVHIHGYRTFGTGNNVYFDDIGDLKLKEIDPYGKEWVWSDFTEVSPLVEHPIPGAYRTREGDSLLSGVTVENAVNFFELESTGPDVSSHNGVATDGSNIYTSDTNALKKWNLGMDTLVASNLDPCGDVNADGGTSLDHVGDIVVVDGRVYAPIRDTAGVSSVTEEWIAVFDASDLSYIESFEISAQNHEAAGIGHNPNDGLLYIGSFYDGTKLWKYDPVDGSFEGTVTLSSTVSNVQGVAWGHGAWWISSSANAGEVYRATTTGDVYGPLLDTPNTTEGLTWNGDDLLVLADTASDDGKVYTYKATSSDLSLGGGFEVSSSGPDLRLRVGSSTTFTLGLTVAISNKSASRVPLAYTESSGTNRMAPGFNSSVPAFNLFDPLNGALNTSVNPTLDQAYRQHVIYDGTTSRRMLVDTVEEINDASITEIYPHLNTIWMGNEGASQANPWRGTIAFVYLYPGVLSDDWIQGEYDQLNDNATFWSVADTSDTPPDTPIVTITSVSATGVSAQTSAFVSGEGGSHEGTDWRITRVSDGVLVYNPGLDTTNKTSIVNAGSTLPLDTASERYKLEARHGEST